MVFSFIFLGLVAVATPGGGSFALSCSNPTHEGGVLERATPWVPATDLSEAEDAGNSMKASVDITVGPDGHLVDAYIFRSSHNAALDKAALEAAKDSTYQPKVVRCIPTTGVYLFDVTFPRVSRRAAYAAPTAILQAVESQAQEEPSRTMRSLQCSSDEFGKALDDLAARTHAEQWIALKSSQRDFAIEFARCAFFATSQDDFNNYAGVMASTLVNSIIGDRKSPEGSASYEKPSASRARAIASWLAANPAITQHERSMQMILLHGLNNLDL